MSNSLNENECAAISLRNERRLFMKDIDCMLQLLAPFVLFNANTDGEASLLSRPKCD